MATISGRVIFDRNRSATIDAGDSGLANVPVILQNIATNVGLVVLTDANGNYSFINVPDGNYRIVEAFGTSGGVATPGDFSTAVVIPFAIGMDPPINFATNPPIGSTNLDSITPNTLLVTVAGSDLVNQNFLDGPVIYTPIQNILDPCVSVSDENLIDAANNGTFGFFPQGTPANTGVPVEPYPEVTPDFTYVLPVPDEFVPDDGEYTVQNIMNNTRPNIIGSWWRIADHTTGDETGRMMVVNGFNPGAIFFRDIVAVEPNTNYLFSSWILNLFKVPGYANPALGVRIIGENGDILYSAMLGGEITVSTEAPEWREVGTVINSGDNTNITVEFISEGPAAIGNDYAIDDVSLREIEVPQFVPVKTISTPTANVGEVVTYTVTLQNTCTSPLTNVFFEDLVPEGLEFVTGSVTINGSPSQGVNPNAGFTIPDTQGGNTATVTFDALVTSVPTPNPTPNTATITYSYTPVEGGIPAVNVVESNPALLEVAEEADVSVVKTASPNPVNPGEVLTYTIVISNAGPSFAENVILTDNIPDSITDVEFSVDGGGTFFPWTGSLDVGTLQAGETGTLIIRGTVSDSATGTITNTAIVTSTTPDPNPDNNTSTVTTEVSSAQSADVSVVKTASVNPANPGGPLITYTIVVSNAGPSAAENVILTDNIPASITGPEFSVNGGGTFNPWTGSLNLGTLAAGTSRTILIRGTVNTTGTITNIAIVSSTTPDPNPNNNTSIVTTVVSPEASADISVVKTASPNPVVPGEVLTYTIVVSNAGPSAAENVILTDNIPASITDVEFSVNGGGTFNPWTGSLNLGTLAAGASRTILVRGTVSNTATGTITNTAIVSSTTPDPNPDNNTSTVTITVSSAQSADVSVVKTVSPNSVAPGERVTYTIVVSNAGPIAAENVVLIDNIPSSIIGAEFSVNGGITFNPWTGSLNLGTLAAGSSRTILIRGTVSQTATRCIANAASVTSTTPDPNLLNNISAICVEISGCADLCVSKKCSINSNIVTYRIVVSNAGPADARNVILEDNIPDEISNVKFSIEEEMIWENWIGFLNIGTLRAGTSITIIIKGILRLSGRSKIINTARVRSNSCDPDLTNNTATAVIRFDDCNNCNKRCE